MPLFLIISKKLPHNCRRRTKIYTHVFFCEFRGLISDGAFNCFELSFVCGVGQLHCFACGYPAASALSVEKTIHFPRGSSWPLWLKSEGVDVDSRPYYTSPLSHSCRNLCPGSSIFPPSWNRKCESSNLSPFFPRLFWLF